MFSLDCGILYDYHLYLKQDSRSQVNVFISFYFPTFSKNKKSTEVGFVLLVSSITFELNGISIGSVTFIIRL